MKVRLVLLTLSLLLAACPSARESGAATVTSWTPTSPDTTDRWHGFELGPTFSVPIPVDDASREELGMNAELSISLHNDSPLAVGVDVAYHYWPVSSEFKEGFNQYLREQTLNILELGGTTWRLNALQFTIHMKVAAPTAWQFRPWLQFGAGAYYIDPNVSGYSGDAGFFTVEAGPLKSESKIGFYLSTGVDLLCGPHTRLGLVGSYHHVSCNDTYGSDLGILSIGAQALFGR